MYKVVWDSDTGGVLLVSRVVEGVLGISPRPVFHEELDLLGLGSMGWSYPRGEAPIMWAVNKQYWYRGRHLFDARGANIYDAAELVLQEGVAPHALEAVDVVSMLRKNADLMFLLESEAKDFIRDTFETYSRARRVAEGTAAGGMDYEALAAKAEQRTKKKMAVVKEDCDSFDVMPLDAAEAQGKKVLHTTHVDVFLASFSGGKDSQVVLDLCTKVIPPSEFRVIYSDTGYELPSSLELYERVQAYYHERFPALSFATTRNHESVLTYWDKIGTPSDTHRWCCSVMKTAPLYRSLKIPGTNKQARVLAFDGVRAEESTKRSAYQRIGKGKHTTIFNAHPILHWNAIEIFLYLFEHNLYINEAYRAGKARVGCLVCPFSSTWDDMISYRCYNDDVKPFLGRLCTWAKSNSIKDVDSYLKERKWKIKAIGNNDITKSSVYFASDPNNFVASVKGYNYSIYAWLPTICEYTCISKGNCDKGELKFNDKIYSYELVYSNNKANYNFIVQGLTDSRLIYLLRRVIYKSTYCIQCEVCEVDCPTGALTIYPNLNIDRSKCVHCYKCLTSHDNGCIAADCIRMVRDMDKKSTANVHAYKKFGIREEWIDEFVTNYNDFWMTNSLGTAQVDGFKSWLKDAEVINAKNELTEFGKCIIKMYRDNQQLAWEMLLVNLSISSYIVSWFLKTIPTGVVYDKQKLNDLISEANTGASKSTNEGAVTALLEMFRYSFPGQYMGLGTEIEKNKYIRKEYDDVSDVAIAYYLYKLKEQTSILSLRVSDFYSNDDMQGPNVIFGVSKTCFMNKLRQLNSYNNRVLVAELNMGLDNITLRDDLKALDAVKILIGDE